MNDPSVELLILSISAMFILHLLCGLVPIFLLRPSLTNQAGFVAVQSGFSCVAAGVFIGVCFVGMIPFAEEKFVEVKLRYHLYTRFPLPEFIAIIGFFFILFIEEGIRIATPLLSVNHWSESEAPAQQTVEPGSDHRDHAIHHDHFSQKVEPGGVFGSAVVEPHSHKAIALEVYTQETGLKFLIMMAAIQLHSFFEGIALGLQDQSDKMISLFFGILLHEAIMAFALGITMSRNNIPIKTSVKSMILFCLCIPLGITVGWMIGFSPGMVGGIINAILQAFAAGVFIHVTFLEIIPHELEQDGPRVLKILFMFVGFVALALISVIVHGIHKHNTAAEDQMTLMGFHRTGTEHPQ
ncbi:unnamed protein product [Cyprideis torosa]|uniref:Zinc transporter ZIP3 n=1 Tax=Cyprideis torosa TaxID=163714 RepID=A0A7R8W3G6_9CRUS|nr:unnamed protein product [Cyprideis torosa]CAG0882949.1 unnamed protein product [Cyprideis torosa]